MGVGIWRESSRPGGPSLGCRTCVHVYNIYAEVDSTKDFCHTELYECLALPLPCPAAGLPSLVFLFFSGFLKRRPHKFPQATLTLLQTPPPACGTRSETSV
jgi:hypothetical protein